MLTKKLTRRIKEKNCAICKLANKTALREGRPYCQLNERVSIVNGICEQRKDGTSVKRRVK